MIDLSYLSTIQFSGADAGDFLHNQLSADVLALNDHESTFACYCEPKGRVLALVLVCKVDEDYLLVLSRDLAKSLSDRLKIYVMRSNVVITHLEESLVAGIQPGESLERDGSTTISLPIPGSDRLLAICNAESAVETNASLSDEWKVAELKRGVSWLSSKSSGEFLPQMLGFDQIGAVNFRKGCYPGQEIVARTHYLGKVKRLPRILITDSAVEISPLEKVQLLVNGQHHGAVVVDSGFSESQGSHVFVVTRLAADIEIDGIEIKGEQVALRQAKA